MITSSVESIRVMDLGRIPYLEAWEIQKQLQRRRIKGDCPDTLILVEHDPVYTLGKNSDENHILPSSPDITTVQVERGGDVTYHGPGQLVAYPILDLRDYHPSITWFMRTLEEIIINTCSDFGIDADRKTGLTGVWVGDEKIAALGVRISRWVTMHGFSLNISPDLSYYDGIIPCGLFEYGVTSMAEVLPDIPDFEQVKTSVIKHFHELIELAAR